MPRRVRPPPVQYCPHLRRPSVHRHLGARRYRRRGRDRHLRHPRLHRPHRPHLRLLTRSLREQLHRRRSRLSCWVEICACWCGDVEREKGREREREREGGRERWREMEREQQSPPFTLTQVARIAGGRASTTSLALSPARTPRLEVGVHLQTL